MPIELKQDERGRMTGTFTDMCDSACTVQKSWIANEPAIWLGADTPDPRVRTTIGWRRISLPDGTICTTQMLMTQEMVRDLLPMLIKFAETGELVAPEPVDVPSCL